MERKFLSVKEILERYKKGERDFPNIVCKGADLLGTDLSGCNFSHSDLSFTDFSRSSFVGCDFTEANLEWSDFTFSNLSKSIFYKANISWSVLNNAIVDKADFSKANLEWSLAFDCRLHAANLSGTQMSTLATDVSQITQEGMVYAEEMLSRLKSSIPFDLWLAIKHNIEKTKGGIQTQVELPEKTVKDYQPSKEHLTQVPTDEYASQKGIYTEKSAYGFETQYARGLSREKRGGEYTR